MPEASASLDEVHFVALGPEHVESAAAIVSQQFVAGEPMTGKLGITEADFVPFALLQCQRAAPQGLSSVCLIGSEVAAVCISEDLISPLLPEDDPAGETADPKFSIIFELLGGIDEAYLAGVSEQEKVPGKFLHQLMVAVSPRFCGRGLATRIISANLEIGRSRGFSTGIIECTGRFSLAAAKKNGYVKEKEIKYEDFRASDGGKPFAGVEASTGHSSTVLLSLALSKVMEMKVGKQKGINFYIRAASSFLKGVEAKEADRDKPAIEAKAPVDKLSVSGLGEAINTAVSVAIHVEADGLGTIANIKTNYLEMTSGRSCAQITIAISRKS